MKQILPRRLDRLPDRILGDPEFQKWQLQDHEDRIQHIEQATPYHLPTVQTPIGKLPLPVFLGLLFWLLYARPDLAYRFLGL